MVASTTAVTIAPGERIRKRYKCSSCDKVFQRSEHCIRHERAHTHEKPFACQFCHKKYARKDLVKRHERTIHADQYEALQAQSINSEQTARSYRHGPSGSVSESTSLDSTSTHLHAVYADHTQQRTQNAYRDSPTLDAHAQHIPSPPIDPELDRQVEASRISTVHSTQHALYSLPSPLTTDRTTENLQDESSAANDAFDISDLGFLDHIAVDHNDERRSKRPRLDPVSNADILTMAPSIMNGMNGQIQTMQPLLDTFDIGLLQNIFSMGDPCPLPNLATTPLSNTSTPSEQFRRLSDAPYETGMETLHAHQNPVLDNSRQLFRQLPRVLQEKPNSPPRFEIDQVTYQSIYDDIIGRAEDKDCQKSIPTIQQLRRFFVGYVDCFHRHMPIIHLPSLVLTDTPSPLILSLSCIGALYRLDRRRAIMTYHLALDLLRKFESQEPTAPLTLWAIQCRILLSVFALFTGDTAMVTTEFQQFGFYVIDYRLRRTIISKQAISPNQMTWSEYVHRESHKRVLCAINIISNLGMVVYDMTPGFINPEDLDFEMPDEEHLWNCKTDAEWCSLWKAHDKQHTRSLRSVLTDIISGNHNENAWSSDQPYHLTAFGGLVLMHAVCIHMWTALQFTRAVGLYSTFGIVGNVSLRALIFSTGISTLSRCQKALLRDDKDGRPIEPLWDVSDGPLLFNCQAVLRIAYTRLFLPEFPFRRMVMIVGSVEEVDEAAAAYVASPLERNDFYAKAAAKACQGFLTPVRMGHLLVRKTAAFGWSIEHAVAGWDSALFLTKWIHTIEIESGIVPTTTEEAEILSQLQESLNEIDFPYDGTSSFASAVARAWALFLTDVWVWGITPKMGFALERLANCYQENLNRLGVENRSHSALG